MFICLRVRPTVVACITACTRCMAYTPRCTTPAAYTSPSSLRARCVQRRRHLAVIIINIIIIIIIRRRLPRSDRSPIAASKAKSTAWISTACAKQCGRGTSKWADRSPGRRVGFAAGERAGQRTSGRDSAGLVVRRSDRTSTVSDR